MKINLIATDEFALKIRFSYHYCMTNVTIQIGFEIAQLLYHLKISESSSYIRTTTLWQLEGTLHGQTRKIDEVHFCYNHEN